MIPYGDLEQVRRLLRPTETDVLGADDEARLLTLQLAITELLTYELGRTFGEPSPETSVTVWAGPSDILLLPSPARSITSVTIGGTVAGGTITGGTLYLSTFWAYHFVDVDTGTIGGLRLLSGSAWGDPHYTTPVVVVGDFSTSDDDTDVPADLTYAVSWMIAERFKQESASPAGFSGPDGTVAAFRELFQDEFVKRILDRYRISTRALVI